MEWIWPRRMRKVWPILGLSLPSLLSVYLPPDVPLLLDLCLLFIVQLLFNVYPPLRVPSPLDLPHPLEFPSVCRRVHNRSSFSLSWLDGYH